MASLSGVMFTNQTGSPEKVVFFQDLPIKQGGNVFSSELPLGRAWRTLYVQIKATPTTGTATGPIADGIANVVESLELSLSGEGEIYSLCGRAAIAAAEIVSGGREFVNENFAGVSGTTYTAVIPIVFSQRRGIRPDDLIVDTANYPAVQLRLLLGGVDRLYTSPGTASCVYTVSVIADYTRDTIDADKTASWLPFFKMLPTKDVSLSPFLIDLPRQFNTAITDVFGVVTDSAAPWTGVGKNDAIVHYSMRVPNGQIGLREVPAGILERLNTFENGYPSGAVRTGFLSHSFPHWSGKLTQGISTALLAALTLEWKATGVTGRHLHVVVAGVRSMQISRFSVDSGV